MERPGDVGLLSMDNRTVEEGDPEVILGELLAHKFTRVGDDDRWKRLEHRDEKDEHEEAKGEEDEIDDEQNLPEGERERWRAVDLFRDEVAAIVVTVEREMGG
ncbi:hypothetical protein Ancab_012077 [Ancistrocladus abbreviatus]